MRRFGLPLLSVLVALSSLAAGNTYASFTATDTETGSVTAGTAQVRLNTTANLSEMVWNVTCAQSDNMAPGDICQDTVKVFNDGSVTLYYTITDLPSLPCFEVTHDAPIDAVNGGDGNVPFKLPPFVAPFNTPATREAETIKAYVKLVDLPACMGASAFVGIRVDASTTP